MTVPKLRFKEFQGNWEENVMSKVGSFKKGSNLSKADLSKEGRPCVLYGELYTTYGPVISEVKSRTDKQINNPVYGKRNDVLIPASGESAEDIATASSLKVNNVLLGGDINIFTPEKDNGIFISYQINSARKKQLVRWAQGASVVHIYKDSLSKLNLRLPSLGEQEKIAGFYEKLELRVKLQHKKIEALQEQKKGLLQKIFSQELRFKDENGEEFPGWKQTSLHKVVTIKYGKDQKAIEVEHGKYPILGTGGIIGYTDTPLYNKESVLIGRKGTIDKPLYRSEPFWTVDTLFYTEIKDGYNPLFVYYLFNTIDWKKYNEASGVPSLSASTLNQIIVEVPSLAEQIKIATLFSTLDKKVDKELKKLRLLKQQKKGLMQQMFV